MSKATIVVPFPSQELMPRFGAPGLEMLAQIGRVVTNPEPRHLSPQELLDLAPDAVVIVGDGPTALDENYFARNTKLLAYIRAGVEILGVDIPAATKAGVIVAQERGLYNEVMVEWIIAAMVMISRGLIDAHNQMRAGIPPDRPWRFQLAGQTLGILGLGDVGRYLAKIARCLGMTVLATDPFATDPPEGIEMLPLNELLQRSRFVSVNVNLSPATRGIIGRREIGLMRRDGYLLNNGRGPLVDEVALADALKAGDIAGAAIDVFASEPDFLATPLREAPNVFLTPHLGSHAVETMDRLARASVGDVERVLRGEPPGTVVNREVLGLPQLRLGRGG